MGKNTEISERIKKLIEFWGINRNSFAKSLGYERSQAVYDIMNGKAKPSFDFFDRLLNSEYSDKVNIDWLISGKGEMIKKKSVKIEESSNFANTGCVSSDVEVSRILSGDIDDETGIESLKNIIMEKDALLKAKDEIIKSKDEIIQLLKDQMVK